MLTLFKESNNMCNDGNVLKKGIKGYIYYLGTNMPFHSKHTIEHPTPRKHQQICLHDKR